jgi:hypothetical protein
MKPLVNFSITLDLRSLITAYSVNNDVIPTTYLTAVYTKQFSDFSMHHNGDEYTVQAYVDQKYEGMKPIYCLMR